MNATEFPIHLLLATSFLGIDIIAAGILFFVLKRREHPLTYVIPSVILLGGVVSAVLVYFNMGPSPA